MNGPTASLRRWGVLSDRYADKQIAASTIDARGRIVALLVEPDATCTQRGPLQRPYSALAVVIDGADITEVALTELDLRFPKIDVLGDGFVLVGARCTMPRGPAATTLAELEAEIPHNGRIVRADGQRCAATGRQPHRTILPDLAIGQRNGAVRSSAGSSSAPGPAAAAATDAPD